MSPRHYRYRITYVVGSTEHVWVRYAVSSERAAELAERALDLLYRGKAELRSVKRMGSAI